MPETTETLAKILAKTQGYTWDLLTDELEDDGYNMCREDFRTMAQVAEDYLIATAAA